MFRSLQTFQQRHKSKISWQRVCFFFLSYCNVPQLEHHGFTAIANGAMVEEDGCWGPARDQESHTSEAGHSSLKAKTSWPPPGQFVISARDWSPAPQDYLALLLPSCKGVLWRCGMVHVVPSLQKNSGALFNCMLLSVPLFITTIIFYLKLPKESKGWSKI